MPSPTTTTAPDPVLVAIAASYAHLDDIRWRVRHPNGTREFIAGERIEVDPEDGGRSVLRFAMADGTEKVFAHGEWDSLIQVGEPSGPDLDKIIRRLHLLGLASHLDIINQGTWLQDRDEWIEYERQVATPTELAVAEHNHALRRMGL